MSRNAALKLHSARGSELHEILSAIEALEQRCHRAGMIVTARGLNNAKNAAGWEAAGNLVRAGKATRGER